MRNQALSVVVAGLVLLSPAIPVNAAGGQRPGKTGVGRPVTEEVTEPRTPPRTPPRAPAPTMPDSATRAPARPATPATAPTTSVPLPPAAPGAPASGFTPGEMAVFSADFNGYGVGTFPRVLRLERGEASVAAWEGQRYLRVTSPARIRIPLPAALPERFTVELTMVGSGTTYHDGQVKLDFGRGETDDHVVCSPFESGVYGRGGANRKAVSDLTARRLAGSPLRCQVMVDAGRTQVFVSDTKVADDLAVVLGRDRSIWIDVPRASEALPVLIDGVRVMTSGSEAVADRCSRAAASAAPRRRDLSGEDVARRPAGELGTGKPVTAPASPGSEPGGPVYEEGRCRSGGAPGYPSLWEPVAAASGLSEAEQVAAWREIGTIALAYRHTLERRPTPEETRRQVEALRSGATTWRRLWRDLAQSPEREQRAGYWAPAPMTADEARAAFGLTQDEVRAEQCFGGLGSGCDGVPGANVAPEWINHFSLPDGTRMAYVELGVAVGSILHDNACLRNYLGLWCSGKDPRELVKSAMIPASLEWNKATWNVLDGRTWRAVFGPYPVDERARRAEWFDDLRSVESRKSMMAQVTGLSASFLLTVPYEGLETRRTRVLLAPPGTALDAPDVAFCASGQGLPAPVVPGKALSIYCR